MDMSLAIKINLYFHVICFHKFDHPACLDYHLESDDAKKSPQFLVISNICYMHLRIIYLHLTRKFLEQKAKEMGLYLENS